MSIPSVMDISDVTEMFSWFPVDPATAHQLVPSKWEIKIHDNGQALLLLMVQNIGKMVLDRILDVGAVGLSHIWIELQGPTEVIPPLPGTTRSLPTRYWYIAPHQIDNGLANAVISLAGISVQRVKTIDVGGDPKGVRSGRVVEDAKSGVGYSWRETINLYGEPRVYTGSQRFYRAFGVRRSAGHVRCESHFLGDAEVVLTASPDSAVGRLGFGTCLKGFSNPVWVRHCRADYKVGYF